MQEVGVDAGQMRESHHRGVTFDQGDDRREVAVADDAAPRLTVNWFTGRKGGDVFVVERRTALVLRSGLISWM